MDVQHFERLLARYERAAADAARFRELRARHVALVEKLGIEQADNHRLERNVKAAEAKINEWAEYATALRSAIPANSIKRKTVVLSPQPQPLKYEMPF